MGGLLLAAISAAMLAPEAAPSQGHWGPWETGKEASQTEGVRISGETNVLKLSGLCAIRAYQVFLSPLSRPVCRFDPSCSRYTLTAVSTAGLVNGIIMGAERISRCHACARSALYPGAGEGALIRDPARDKPIPLRMLTWFGL